MLKRKLLISGTIVIIVACITASGLFAQKLLYPEPKERRTDMPKSYKWNPEEGEYYNANEYEWDPQSGGYVDKKLKAAEKDLQQKVSSGQVETLRDPIDVWMEQHKDSKEQFDIALINYETSFRKYSIEHRDEMIGRAAYDPNFDPSLKILLDLGVTHLPRMITHIEKE
ncbi:MAG: hypothetical protein N3B21_05935 [Clostridia bacterium]|nr:hypothetical protein [Clostridia bacterium]